MQNSTISACRISTKKAIHQNDIKNKGNLAKLYPKGQNAKDGQI